MVMGSLEVTQFTPGTGLPVASRESATLDGRDRAVDIWNWLRSLGDIEWVLATLDAGNIGWEVWVTAWTVAVGNILDGSCRQHWMGAAGNTGWEMWVTSWIVAVGNILDGSCRQHWMGGVGNVLDCSCG